MSARSIGTSGAKPAVSLDFDDTGFGENTYARILLLGPAKIGKTTCVLKDARKAYLINCDGPSGPHGAVKEGAKFKGSHVINADSFDAAITKAEKSVEAGESDLVVLDTVSLLVDSLIDEQKDAGKKWPDLWTIAEEAIIKGLKRLIRIPAHLIVISHMSSAAEGAAGILPSIQGKRVKERFPGWLDDWILIEWDAQSGERKFLLGPQKNWSYSGRNVRKSQAVKAELPALFEALGLKL